MITEDYCSYEVAKLLKEKGFDWECEHVIWDGADDNYENYHKAIPNPTHQMAIAWILEKYNVSIEVSVLKRNYWVYTIYKILDNMVEELYNDGSFKSREDAVEAALKYYIENLL